MVVTTLKGIPITFNAESGLFSAQVEGMSFSNETLDAVKQRVTAFQTGAMVWKSIIVLRVRLCDSNTRDGDRWNIYLEVKVERRRVSVWEGRVYYALWNKQGGGMPPLEWELLPLSVKQALLAEQLPFVQLSNDRTSAACYLPFTAEVWEGLRLFTPTQTRGELLRLLPVPWAQLIQRDAPRLYLYMAGAEGFVDEQRLSMAADCLALEFIQKFTEYPTDGEAHKTLARTMVTMARETILGADRGLERMCVGCGSGPGRACPTGCDMRAWRG